MSARMRGPLIAILITAQICSSSSRDRSGSPNSLTYITHVTVIDTETGAENTDQTVTVAGDRITAVQASSSEQPAAGAQVIDGSGKFLIPGLWDMHVHGASDERAGWSYPLYIANGVTGVRDMWGPSNAHKFRAHLERHETIAPHLYLASPIVDGSPPVWRGSVVVTNASQARKFVDEQKRNGADFIKVYNNLNRDSYFAIADESKRQEIPFAGHVPLAVSAWEASASGQRTIEHLRALPLAVSTREDELRRAAASGSYRERNAGALWALQSYSQSKADRLFQEFKKNQTWQVPTLTVLRATGMLTDPQFTRDARLHYVPYQDRQQWNASADFRFRDWTAADFLQARQLFQEEQKLVGAMFRAGVPMLAGTDTMNPYCFPGFSLHDELALLVESGVTPLGALQMATRNPAIFMNATDRYGSIASGKIADLVLLDADPLQDIRNTTKIRAVFLAGRLFDRAGLDHLLK